MMVESSTIDFFEKQLDFAVLVSSRSSEQRECCYLWGFLGDAETCSPFPCVAERALFGIMQDIDLANYWCEACLLIYRME